MIPCIISLCAQVAACVCLFALDKPEAIPVDTHVWQLATRYYLPNLKGAHRNPSHLASARYAVAGCMKHPAV